MRLLPAESAPGDFAVPGSPSTMTGKPGSQPLGYTSSRALFLELPGNAATSEPHSHLLTGTKNRMPMSRGLVGVALVVMLGALGLTGCGGGSHVESTTGAGGTRSSVASSASGGTDSAGGVTTAAHNGSAAGHSNSSPPADRRSSNASSRTQANAVASNASTGVPYEVHTTSMEPSYRFGTKVYYDPTRADPQIGDVIVFYLPVGGTESSCGTVMEGRKACAVSKPGLTKMLAIKRVVGLPGDTIAIHEGKVIRNGRPEPEPRTIACGSGSGCEFAEAITVPAGAYYVLGDNRQLYHEDSRVWGALPRTAIVGIVEGG
jgi:signal peptidase I